jgi:hypothetical protein
MDPILTTIQSSLSNTKFPINGNGTQQQQQKEKQPLFLKDTASSGWDDADADAIIDDLSEFVDHGEGAGIEGDLDLEDD